MVAESKRPPVPSGDKRWRIIDASMRRHGYSPNALIESLHSAQECFGYLDEAGIRFVARSLRVPLSKAFGVATFYHYFTLKPPGEHTCVVCLGTACYIKGAIECIQSLEKEYGIKAGQTTLDGKLSILTARCLGSCGLAPAVVFDGEIAGKLDRTQTLKRVGKWTGHES